MPIRNIIFDLGGVIINLNYKLTIEAFRSQGVINDNIDNVMRARRAGIHGFYLGKDNQISELVDFIRQVNGVVLDVCSLNTNKI
jgi:hypothetical protein